MDLRNHYLLNCLLYICRSQSEQREYDAMLQIRESVQMVEAAVLEKDQVSLCFIYVLFESFLNDIFKQFKLVFSVL